MTTAALLITSRQELVLYQELWAVYGRLAAGLADPQTDVTGVADDGARAAAVTAALRELGLTLAPHRASRDALHEDVTAVWRESAILAAAAAETNRRLQAAARQRQQVVAAQLSRMATGATATARYRHASV